MTSKRCLIVDPVCAITYGHSLNSLSYFSDLARKYFDEVEIYASRHLPFSKQEDKINRFFNFYYENLISISKIPAREHDLDEDFFRDMNDAAAYDFYRLFSNVNTTQDDTILFPSADYHSLIGVSNAIRRLPAAKRPRLLVRLINVMENHLSLGPNILPIPVQRVISLLKEGYNVSFSAETPKYARYIAGLSGIDIKVTPYPAFPTNILPIETEGSFTVLCGGSGRADKGFFRLIDIIELVNVLSPEIRFIVQNLRDQEQMSKIDYLNRLYAIPNVKLLPGILTYSEIITSYAESHISLMPYDAPTYEYRGSAMLMESILFGRQCVGQSGTGFAEQIDFYGSGKTCGSNSEMAEAIIDMSQIDRDALKSAAAQSRGRYISDSDQKYADWMKI